MLRRFAFPLFTGLGLLFLLWLRFHQPPNTVDDAYITFRYARNLINGNGLVYNPGEHVLGTTTPAYAMLLAVSALVSGYRDFPRLALALNSLLTAISFALLLRLTTRLTGRRWAGLAAGLLLALDGRLLDFSTGGMESAFYVTAILGAWVLALENRTAWAAVMTGFVCLIRPDGATLAAAFFGMLCWESLRSAHWRVETKGWPWKELGLFALVVGPWFIFAVLYFGQPIPQSVLAKSAVYRVPPLTALRALMVQLRAVFSFSLPPLRDGQSLARQIAQVLLPGALVVLGLIAAQRRNRRAWAIGLYLALFITLFALGNPFWIGWYEIPIAPFYSAFILTAVVWLAKQVSTFKFQVPKFAFNVELGIQNVFVVTTFALMALPFLSRLNVVPWEKPQQPAWVLNAAFNKRREFDYQLIAHMLAPAAQNDRQVAIPEIGAFGYTYGTPNQPGRLFDTTGLISPKTLTYFPIPKAIPFEIYSVPRPLMMEQKFDVFVSFDNFIQATIPLDDPEFLALYRPTLGLTSHAAFGIQRLMAYRRNDLPIEVALPPEATPVNAHFGPEYARLVGYETLATADSENHYIDAVLYWQGRAAPIDRDLLVRVQLANAAGAVVYEILRQPGEGLFPSQTWTPGFWLVDRYPLIQPAPDAGPYTIRVTVFAADADAPLPALAADGAALPEATFTFPAGNPPPAP